jgi:ribosomal protein L12E/L44/L45/RPP1/RPP2
MKDLAAFLNLSEADVKAKLKDGQSLAQIAQAQNISEDQLIAHIKDSMTDKIKGFVEKVHKAKPAPAAPAASADAAGSSAPAAQQ